jgi:translation initiation factor 3 subunit B
VFLLNYTEPLTWIQNSGILNLSRSSMAPLTFEQKLANLRKEAEIYANYLSDEEVEDAATTLKHEEEDFCNDYSMCIVVGGLPVVDEAKHGKLLNVVKKIFGQVGNIVDIQMPYDKNGSTSGFAFIEFEQESNANDAVRTINNFAMDKRHTLLVNKYSDLNKYKNVPEEFVAPKVEKFSEPKNLKKWLTDSGRRDMFVLRHGSETEIFWSDKGEITLDYDGEREKKNGKQWCSQYVLWSPQGTYLATFHPQGIAIWAGDKYEKVGRFAHKNVKIAVFSPMENYLITLSETEQENAIIIWDVKTGKMLRAFPPGKSTGQKDEVVQGLLTPFKWSFDDKYVARRGKDVISIYELPSMKLLEKKSLKADGIHDFFWSPTDSTLAYWAPESTNCPARVSLVEIPSRVEIRQKNLFNVSDCKLHWHPNGTFLCVKVTRHSKSKKTLYTNFEMFRVREALIPVEMLEMKETIVAFAWEPKGTRFATVHGEGNQRRNVSFYDMNGGTKNNEITSLYTLNEKPCSHLYWSPHGNNIVLAGLGEINGILEFWDTDEKQSISIQEHFTCTHVEWDPSGRVVASSVCQPIDNSYYKYQTDNGFHLWTLQGKLISKEKKDAFYQFSWRPRPLSLLTDEEYSEVVKNLKKYEKRFNEADRLKERERLAAEAAERQRQQKEFQDILTERLRKIKSLRKERIALLNGYDSEDETHYIVQSNVREIVLSEKEEVVRNM